MRGVEPKFGSRVQGDLWLPHDYGKVYASEKTKDRTSEQDNATLVYDRHNLIYAYGPIERFKLILESVGHARTPEVSLAFEHQHCYYPEFDVFEQELTTKFADRKTDLQPGDENPS